MNYPVGNYFFPLPLVEELSSLLRRAGVRGASVSSSGWVCGFGFTGSPDGGLPG